jgi:hypothetical protein
VPLRRLLAERLMSPFTISCVDSFRDAYARTGMNLTQSLVVFAVAMAQKMWREGR